MPKHKKIVPPPFKKKASLIEKIKSAIKSLEHKLDKPLHRLFYDLAHSSVAAVLILASVGYVALKGPELHGAFLRAKVGSKVYMIKGKLNGGGGTGFALQAPSGVSYIVTNSHVCEGALTQSEDKTSLLVVSENRVMRRKIIENSNFTDLCLLEGLPGVEGLSLGDEPTLGSTQAIVGHPRLRPLSISRGEIVGKNDVKILNYMIESPEDEAKCNLPKNEIIEENIEIFGMEFKIKACLNVTKQAYMSTILIFPGNSGSPVVDFLGRVEGVAFASDGTNWAHIVSLKDLQRFIAHY